MTEPHTSKIRSKDIRFNASKDGRRIYDDDIVDPILRIVADVAALPVGGKDADQPTQFTSGYQLACEEITERIRTEVHVLPGDLTLPAHRPCGHVRIDPGEVHFVPKVRDADATELVDGQKLYAAPCAAVVDGKEQP